MFFQGRRINKFVSTVDNSVYLTIAAINKYVSSQSDTFFLLGLELLQKKR
jgi:hypothetical protein